MEGPVKWYAEVGSLQLEHAMTTYPLCPQILDEGIQDDKMNVTRFVALARDPVPPVAGDDRLYKTSIVFSLNEGPGMLFKVRVGNED